MPDLIVASLGAFLIVVGLSHFVFPGYFARLVPPWFPWARPAAFASGVLEIALGVGLLVEPARSAAAWAIVVLMATYVLTHVDALLRSDPQSPSWLDRPVGATARVLVNLGYVYWALVVAWRA